MNWIDPHGMLRYNKPPPATVPPTGNTLESAKCVETCVRGFLTKDLLVTGGEEKTGHSPNSCHYESEAVDFAGPKFNSVPDEVMMECAKDCGFGHGMFEDYPGDNRDHWHFQFGQGLGVPEVK